VDLKDYVFFQEGPGLRKWQWTEAGMKVINVTNILADGSVDISNTSRFISLDEFKGKYSHFAIDAGDVVVASSGNTYGKVGRIKGCHLPIMMNTSVIRFRPINPEKLHPDYLYAFLRSDFFRAQIERFVVGSAQPNFGPTHVKLMQLIMPEWGHQRRIASVISAYDDLIENNTRRIEILEEMARRLYEEWFVQFRFPGHEGVKFKESELGLIPEDWKVSTLDEFGEIITGKTPSKNNSEFFGGVVPFIKLPDMHGNTFIIETSERLSQEGVSSQKTKTIPPGSICVSCIGTAGVVVITSEPSQTNQQINSIVPRAPGLREFLFFSATALKEKINNYGATGATMTNLSRGKFASLQVVEPKEDLLCGYNKLAAPLFDKILCLQKANRNLRAQRDLLLPKLISGEIDVSDIPMPT